MNFDSVEGFIMMGGHGLYIWSAWGIALLVVLFNVVAPIRNRSAVIKAARAAIAREQAAREQRAN